MDNKKTNRFLSVAYKLYATKNGHTNLFEEATASSPFQFITGLSVAIDAFEKEVEKIEAGGAFDFVIDCAHAYGEHFEDRVIELEREAFTVNGKFDDEHVKLGAVIPMQNDEGQRFLGQVMDITTDHVQLDMNHPLAGYDLNFKGEVLENREATNKEIEKMIRILSGDCECHGGCGGKHHNGGCCGGCGGSEQADGCGGCGGGCHE